MVPYGKDTDDHAPAVDGFVLVLQYNVVPIPTSHESPFHATVEEAVAAIEAEVHVVPFVDV